VKRTLALHFMVHKFFVFSFVLRPITLYYTLAITLYYTLAITLYYTLAITLYYTLAITLYYTLAITLYYTLAITTLCFTGVCKRLYFLSRSYVNDSSQYAVVKLPHTQKKKERKRERKKGTEVY